ncbi:hypothetical protein [Streptomyces sp. AC495_CC817]|uniref:hypothetical protein n=1 Tax=Streptomyces sp. AC495_CC817 TaxID=2823900 RepID=UPI001C278E89|nr:hypothetical protein [Streptomyces sp. AC495_CC817]
MRWDRLFEDLEGQLAAEWEAERAVLDAESERLRISRLDLRHRLRLLGEATAPVTLDLPGGHRRRAVLRILGADWLAADQDDGGRERMLIVPLSSLRGVACDLGLVLASAEDRGERAASLRERMTLGFVLRDLARRRIPVRLATIDGDDLHGTIDRAGADHLDLAIHDPGEARTARAVQGFRILPLAAVAWLQPTVGQLP